MKISYFRNHIDTFEQNPQYLVTLTDPDELDEDDLCTVIVSLTQKRSRQLGQEEEAEELLSIGKMNILVCIEVLSCLHSLLHLSCRVCDIQGGGWGWGGRGRSAEAGHALLPPHAQQRPQQNLRQHAGGGGQVGTRLLSGYLIIYLQLCAGSD